MMAAALHELISNGTLAGCPMGVAHSRLERALGQPTTFGLSGAFSCCVISRYLGGRLEVYSVDELVRMAVFEFHRFEPVAVEAFDGVQIGRTTSEAEIQRLMGDFGLSAAPRVKGVITDRFAHLEVGYLNGFLHSIGTGDLSAQHLPFIRKPRGKRPLVENSTWELVVRAPNGTRIVVKDARSSVPAIGAVRGSKAIYTRKGRVAFRKAESQVLSWMQDATFMAELLEADARVFSPPRPGWKSAG